MQAIATVMRDDRTKARMTRAAWLVAGVCVAWLNVSPAQEPEQDANTIIEGEPTAEFHFARLIYRNAPGSRRGRGGWGGGSWSTDSSKP